VFYEPLTASDKLDQAALAKYKYFVGDLWGRYGEDAWIRPWKAVYTRPADGRRDIVAAVIGELELLHPCDLRFRVHRSDNASVTADNVRGAFFLC
jgi:hypothetical protein